MGKGGERYDIYLPSSKLNLAQANDRRYSQTKRATFVKNLRYPAHQLRSDVDDRVERLLTIPIKTSS